MILVAILDRLPDWQVQLLVGYVVVVYPLLAALQLRKLLGKRFKFQFRNSSGELQDERRKK